MWFTLLNIVLVSLAVVYVPLRGVALVTSWLVFVASHLMVWHVGWEKTTIFYQTILKSVDTWAAIPFHFAQHVLPLLVSYSLLNSAVTPNDVLLGVSIFGAWYAWIRPNLQEWYIPNVPTSTYDLFMAIAALSTYRWTTTT
jgi:hypothetical protein